MDPPKERVYLPVQRTRRRIKTLHGTPQIDRVITRHREILRLATEIYGDLPPCDIRISSRMKRTLGTYGFHRTRNFHRITYSLSHIQNNVDDMVDNTVPHEIAHFVCRVYQIGNMRHDRAWKQVCLRLGGDGQTCSRGI